MMARLKKRKIYDETRVLITLRLNFRDLGPPCAADHRLKLDVVRAAPFLQKSEESRAISARLPMGRDRIPVYERINVVFKFLNADRGMFMRGVEGTRMRRARYYDACSPCVN